MPLSSSSIILRFPSKRASATCRPRHSSSSKLRARSQPDAACWCSTSRPAASRITTCERLFELIARLKQQGLAIVYISHFIEEVMQVSDRFVVLRDGRNAGEGITSDAHVDRIVGLMVGRTLEDLYPRRSREIGAASSRGERPQCGSPRPRDVHTASRRDFRHCRPARRGPDSSAARAVRARAREERRSETGCACRTCSPPIGGTRNGDAQRGPDGRGAGHSN